MPGSEVVQQLPPAASLSFCRERPARAINHMENKAVDLWPSVSQSAAEGPMVRRLSGGERWIRTFSTAARRPGISEASGRLRALADEVCVTLSAGGRWIRTLGPP
jgi:hypothetical protein